jgi:hypothetical protein
MALITFFAVVIDDSDDEMPSSAPEEPKGSASGKIAGG